MTHYWWMHWFWITFCFYQQLCVTFGHSLLTTLHSNPATTESPTTKPINLIEANSTERNVSQIPPRILSPIVLRNNSQYARNASARNHEFARRPDGLPLDVPLIHNITESVNNTIDSPVINQNDTDHELSGNFTGFISNFPNGNKSISVTNHTENITYFGDELSYNHSFVQSERIGIEGQDLGFEDTAGNLSAAGITGITLGCIIVVGIICGISFFVYHNQGFNRPQVLNDRCSNPDSSGYIDDASVRDNSEEMYSLDNDSFLNSLEAMTIQNYWTDTVKHTKL
ncbi:uncharacterized protein LOC109540889 isoform X1 [Dendroctonus ponderosae]|uniref:uncharacterized protein LOC109540889 isoform X1 n=1 Tax=Dendroctonus ponderosae TaxID=77166 RepID=UPI00203521C2|nr:uncharacterized protein LOC109540889 isoform X1 [Dendroctonus ponderosae]KAH1029927.1 hypothetical protein HUJ05_003073 [Dendroctonus ponderosae]